MRSDGTYDHMEAFCHMTYASKEHAVVRSIWNSRDGVTPFGCSDPDTGVELTHVDWSLDRCDPLYVPALGEWVWIDLHPERALQLAMQQVERWWDHPEYPARQRWATKEEAARAFYDSTMYFSDPASGERRELRPPDLVQVTEPFLEQLRATREAT